VRGGKYSREEIRSGLGDPQSGSCGNIVMIRYFPIGPDKGDIAEDLSRTESDMEFRGIRNAIGVMPGGEPVDLLVAYSRFQSASFGVDATLVHKPQGHG